MGEWRTIDSAPKDGTRILLWCPDMKPIFSPHGETGAAIAARFVKHGLEEIGGYWACFGELRRRGIFRRRQYWKFGIVSNPSHWQSLPGAPQ